MSAVVQLFPDNRQGEPPVQEVRVADCDNGYLRIANELFDEILKCDLSKHQLKVALAVIRKTYGFNKKSDRFTNAQISEMTGIPETRVCTAKTFLLDAKILTYFGREIGFNKNLNEWSLNIPQKREESPKTGCKSFPETGNHHSPKQGNTKDTYTKDKKDKEILKDFTPQAKNPPSPSAVKKPKIELDYSSWPSMPDQQTLSDWIQHRKTNKAPVSQTVLNTFGKELHLAVQSGFSVDECLSESITRGWRGFKAAWLLRDRDQFTGHQTRPPMSNIQAAQQAAREAKAKGWGTYDDDTILS